MSERAFLDTNILVYADDLDSPGKRVIAQSIIGDCLLANAGVLSTQVLQEFFAVSVTKFRTAAEEARRRIELFASLEVFPIGVEDILGAIDLHRLHGYSFWDCLILRAALQSGCTVLYSEDLEHGRRFEGLTVVNPFLEIEPAAREKPAEYRARKSPEARRARRK